MERLDPFEQPAVLVGTQIPISKICRKAPVYLPLLDASGVVPFHLVAELVLLFYIASVGIKQIEVVIGILAGDYEFRPQFVSATLCPSSFPNCFMRSSASFDAESSRAARPAVSW